MKRSRTRILAIFLIALATISCGDDDSAADPTLTTVGATTATVVTTTVAPGGGGDAIDACALVTQADAERILGEPFEFVETSEPDVVVAACVWSNVAADHGANLQFRVFDGAHFFGEDAWSTIEGYEPVSGLGDDAYWVADDNTVTLTVLSGNLVFILDASKGGGGFDGAAVQIELLGLAERILAAI
jgi:hypothetical protein